MNIETIKDLRNALKEVGYSENAIIEIAKLYGDVASKDFLF
jgi:hypothetical protein